MPSGDSRIAVPRPYSVIRPKLARATIAAPRSRPGSDHPGYAIATSQITSPTTTIPQRGHLTADARSTPKRVPREDAYVTNVTPATSGPRTTRLSPPPSLDATTRDLGGKGAENEAHQHQHRCSCIGDWPHGLARRCCIVGPETRLRALRARIRIRLLKLWRKDRHDDRARADDPAHHSDWGSFRLRSREL